MHKILIVDDEDRIVKILWEFLLKMGFDVIAVSSGNEALEILRSDIKPDLMIVDMKMPKISGLDVVKEMVKINKRIPTIMLTGSPEAEKNIFAFKDLGFCEFDVIHKPADLFEILELIKTKLQIK